MDYIKTKKFNDVSISVRCFFDLKTEMITAFHLLLIMMKAKCEKYPSKQALSNALSDAYGFKSSHGFTGYGNDLMMENNFQYIHSSWIDEDSYLPQVIEIMDQIMFHSVLDEESLEEAKYLLRNRLIHAEDNPEAVATKLAFEAIEGSALSVPIVGRLEDIDTIELEDIEALYKELVMKKRYVYICGNIEEEVMRYLQSLDCDEKPEIHYEILDTEKTYYNEQEKDISQTCLVQLYQTGIRVDEGDYYPLLVANSVLGQSPCNLLFKEIREKNSLCYSISSSLIRFDGALMIRTGTFEKALSQVQELIQSLIQRLVDQDISEEEIEISKMDIVDGLVSSLDNPNSLIQQNFLNQVLKRDYDVYGVIERINNVTIEDISRVASKFKWVSTAIVKEAK